MRRALEDLLRETTLLTLAAAIALGWSAVELAQSVSGSVVGFLSKLPDDEVASELNLFYRPLSIRAGDHVLVLSGVLDRALAFTLVLALVLLVLRRRLRV